MIEVATINEQDNTQKKRISILLEFKEILSDGSHGYIITLSNGTIPLSSRIARSERDCITIINRDWGYWSTFAWDKDVDIERFHIYKYKTKDTFSV